MTSLSLSARLLTCLLAGAGSGLAGEATTSHLCLDEKEDMMPLDMVEEDMWPEASGWVQSELRHGGSGGG